jgi:hypothetical protein
LPTQAQSNKPKGPWTETSETMDSCSWVSTSRLPTWPSSSFHSDWRSPPIALALVQVFRTSDFPYSHALVIHHGWKCMWKRHKLNVGVNVHQLMNRIKKPVRAFKNLRVILVDVISSMCWKTLSPKHCIHLSYVLGLHYIP